MKTLERLGFTSGDRVVIFHADDIGMCQASVEAYHELVEYGLLSSAATMVPCAWFPSVARYCREHENIDMGVHLTLTSEWNTYRWTPVSTSDRDSGMLDDEGYFFRTSEAIQENGDVASVQREINMQIERALAAEIDATHIDSHMGAVFHPKYLNAYIQAALSYHLPMLMFRWNEAELKSRKLSDEMITTALEMTGRLEEQGIPLIDHLVSMPLEDVWENRVDQIKPIISNLKPGLTHFIIHPSKDTPELRAITPDWQGRFGDYQTFLSDDFRSFVEREGIKVIGYRALRDSLRYSQDK